MEAAQPVLRGSTVLGRGFFKPCARGSVVLRHAETSGIEEAELVLGVSVILRSCFFKPLPRCAVVKGNAVAAGVVVPKGSLGSGVSLGSGFFQPFAGGCIIFGYAFATAIEFAKAVLCLGIALCGGFFQPFAGIVVVGGGKVVISQFTLRDCIAALGKGLQQAVHGSNVVLCAGLLHFAADGSRVVTAAKEFAKNAHGFSLCFAGYWDRVSPSRQAARTAICSGPMPQQPPMMSAPAARQVLANSR